MPRSPNTAAPTLAPSQSPEYRHTAIALPAVADPSHPAPVALPAPVSLHKSSTRPASPPPPGPSAPDGSGPTRSSGHCTTIVIWRRSGVRNRTAVLRSSAAATTSTSLMHTLIACVSVERIPILRKPEIWNQKSHILSARSASVSAIAVATPTGSDQDGLVLGCVPSVALLVSLD